MDPGTLVAEQIDAGAKLAEEFDRTMPLSAAFWVKKADDERWYFHLVSDRINEGGSKEAYGVVGRIFGRYPDVGNELVFCRLRVSGPDEPVAKAIIDIQRKHPSSKPVKMQSRLLGDLFADAVYLYPLPVCAHVAA